MIKGPLRTLRDPFLGQFPGMHFAIDDAEGGHIVVEYIAVSVLVLGEKSIQSSAFHHLKHACCAHTLAALHPNLSQQGKANVYDNTAVGVLTNDPPLPWHLDNILAYASLSPKRPNASAPLLNDVMKERDSMELPYPECVGSPTLSCICIKLVQPTHNSISTPRSLGFSGANTFGMPGDLSPPSRFINVSRCERR